MLDFIFIILFTGFYFFILISLIHCITEYIENIFIQFFLACMLLAIALSPILYVKVNEDKEIKRCWKKFEVEHAKMDL